MPATYGTSATGGGTTGTTDRTVTTTPAVGGLVIVHGSFSVNTNVAPTCSDNNPDGLGQYDLILSGLWNAGANSFCLFVRKALTSNTTSTVITIASGANDAGAIVAQHWAGMNRAGWAAVRQAVKLENQASGTATPVFGSAALFANPTIWAVASADTTLTPPTGWLERQDTSQITPTVALEVSTRNSGFAGTSVAGGDVCSTAYGAMLVELNGPVYWRASNFGGSSTGTTDRTCSITPEVGDLLVGIIIVSDNTNATPTCTDDQGGTYDRILATTGGQPTAGGAGTLSIFVRTALMATTSSTTLTFATGSNTAGAAVVVAISGMARTGAAAVRQSAQTNYTLGPSAAAATFAAAVLTQNMTLGAVGSATTASSPPTNWTERHDTFQTLPNCALEVVTRDNGYTGTTITWNGTDASYAVGILELDSRLPDVSLSLAGASYAVSAQAMTPRPARKLALAGASYALTIGGTGAPAFVAVGAVSGGTTSTAPAIPAGSVGDLLCLFVVNKYPTNGPSTPTGWIAPPRNQYSGGSGAPGPGSGTVYATWFIREADGSEGATVTVSIPGGNSICSMVIRYSKPAGSSWSWACAGGSDNSNGTSWSVTCDVDPGIAIRDVVLVGSGFQVLPSTHSAEALAVTGLTFGAMTERADTNVTSGDDTGLVISEHPVSGGTSTAAPIYTATCQNPQAGATVLLRLRAVAASDVVFRYMRKLVLDGATVAVSAQAATLRAARLLSLAGASVAVSAQAMTPKASRKIGLASASYAVAAGAIGLLASRRLGLAAASYAITAQTAALLASRRLALGSDSYAVTAENVDLVYTPNDGYSLALDGADYEVTAGATALFAQRRLGLASASYAVAAQAVALLAARRLTLGGAGYLVDAQTAGLHHGHVLALGAASYVVSAEDATLRAARRLVLGSASYAVTASDLRLLRALRFSLEGSSYSVTAQPLTLVHGYSLSLGSAAYAVAAQSVSMRAARRIALDGVVYLVTAWPLQFRVENAIPDLIIFGPDLSPIIVAGPSLAVLTIAAPELTVLTLAAPATGAIVVAAPDITPIEVSK